MATKYNRQHFTLSLADDKQIDFYCYTTETLNGFCHTIKSYNGITGDKIITDTKSSYINRTWERYRQDIADCEGIDADDLTEEQLADFWYHDNEINYEAEQANLNEDIDGYIIALGHRSSHYGAICGNGREGTKLVGQNIADILQTNGDNAEWWAEDYNINGRTGDHDGSWSIVYRVCKNSEEAERLQELACEGKLSNSDIMARSKSLYPYIAKIYGWPYRGSKKSA